MWRTHIDRRTLLLDEHIYRYTSYTASSISPAALRYSTIWWLGSETHQACILFHVAYTIYHITQKQAVCLQRERERERERGRERIGASKKLNKDCKQIILNKLEKQRTQQHTRGKQDTNNMDLIQKQPRPPQQSRP